MRKPSRIQQIVTDREKRLAGRLAQMDGTGRAASVAVLPEAVRRYIRRRLLESRCQRASLRSRADDVGNAKREYVDMKGKETYAVDPVRLRP